MSETQASQHLPFYEGSFITTIINLWPFQILKRFKTEAPTYDTLFQAPKSFKANIILKTLQISWDIEKQRNKPSYLITFIRAYKRDITMAVLSISLGFIIILIAPFTVQNISYYLQDQSDNQTEALIYAALYSLFIFIYGLTFQYGLFRVVYTSMKLKAGTGYFIFSKLLKMDHIIGNSKKGELLASLGADVEVFEAAVVIIMLPSFAIFMIGAAIVLYILVGYPGLIGLSFILLEMFLLHQLNNFIMQAKSEAGEYTDQRLKLTANLIEGIRIIKLYSWESSYSQQLSKIRQNECKKNVKRGAYDSLAKALNVSGLGISLLIIIGLHKLADEKPETEKLFGAMAVLLIAHDLGTRLFALVFHLFSLIKASAKRLTKVILLTERKDYRQFRESKYALRIVNGVFSWEQEENFEQNQTAERLNNKKFQISEIDLRIRPSELIIIIGQVGSGKTSLLLSMLGELECISGEIILSDKISFAAQEPWIIQGTIRQNILMGKEYDKNVFQQVVEVCQLQYDLDKLENSDLTLVGDKGITLSGGQKARIALARAIYQDFGIIAMDDPLSAVDSDVGQKLFFQCINGYLNYKTRILVTHNLQYLQYADRIIVMQKGRISFFGGYEKYLLFDQDYVHQLGLNNQCNQDAKQYDQLCWQRAQSEKEENVNIPISVYWKYFIFGCYSIVLILLWVLIYVIGQVLYFAVLFWIGYWSNQSSNEQQEDYYSNVLTVIVVLATVFGYLRSSWLMAGLINASRRLHDAAISSLIKTQAQFFDNNAQGQILSKFTRDVILLDDVLSLIFAELCNGFGQIVGSLIVIVVINYYSLIFILLEFLLAIFLIRKTVGTMRQMWKLDQDSRGVILSHLNNVVSDLVSVRSMEIENYMMEEMEASVNKSVSAAIHFCAVMSFFQNLLFAGSSTIIIIVTFVLISAKDEIDDPNLGLILVLALGITINIVFAGFQFAQTGVLMSSVPRLLKYADLPDEEQNTQGETLIVTNGEIEFQEVFMKYRENGQYVLNQLSFNCPAGKKVAIIGRTGAGKSSIMLALMRMYPIQQGRILIDGVNISKVTIKSVRRSISIIPQTPTIFKVNLRNNLDPLNLYTDDQLKEVMNQIKLQDLDLQDMPELSTGQKQLLCLGRAIVQKTKILLLDEATASVDTETDKFIQKKIQEIYSNCTIISIAHRLRTIVNSDFICVMKNGQVQEFGPPGDLLKNPESHFLQLIDAAGDTESKQLKSLIKNRYN